MRHATPLLYAIAEQLATGDEPGAHVGAVLQLLAGYVPYDRAALLDTRGVLAGSAVVVPADLHPERREALVGRAHTLLKLLDARDDAPVVAREPGVSTGNESVTHLAVPLFLRDRITGVVLVERAGASYEESHLSFLSIVAGQLGAYLTGLGVTQELRALADNSPDVLSRFDRELRHVFVSAAVTRATGRTPQEIVGRTNAELGMPPDLCALWDGRLRDVFATGAPASLEFSFDGPHGRRHYLARLAPERSVTGEIAHVLVVASDCTRQRDTERELTLARQRYETALSAAPVTLTTQDTDLRYLWIHSPSGAIEADSVGRRDQDVLHGPDAAQMIDVKRAVLATGVGCRVEVSLDIAGEPRVYDLTVEPIRQDGAIVGIACAAIDITQTRACAQLTELESVYASIPLGLCVFDRELRYVRVNERLAEMNGIPAADHIGRTAREVVPDLAAAAEATLRTIFETGEAVRDIEFTGTTPAQPGVVRTWVEQWLPLKALDGRVFGVHGVAEEVTEQRRLEAERRRQAVALQRTADLLQVATDAAELGIHEYDVTTGTIWWDGRVRELWGVPADLPITFDVFMAGVHPDDRAAVQAAVDRVLDPSGSGAYAAEYRVISRADGQERWIRATGRATFNGCHAVRLVGTVLDVTEDKRREQALTERERRFSALANAMPQLVFTSRPNGDPEFLNDQWAAYTGRPLAALTANDAETWARAMHPDDVAVTQQRWARAVQSGAPYEAEFRLRRHDGVYAWFLARARPQFGPDGTIERWIGTCTDIDAAKVVEQVLRDQEAALRESEERFRILADGAPVLIWVNSLTGCEFVNRQYLEFTGLTMSQITGLLWAAVIHPDDREAFTAAYGAALATGAPFEAVCRLRRHDGEYRWTKSSARARRTVDSTLQGYVGCTIDITEMRLAEETLREADRTKDRFLATLSHELRNPLAPIRTAAQILASPKLDGEQLVWARQVIQRQVKHMAWLLDDLLDIARITQGKLVLKKERVSLTGAVDAAIETARPLLDRKHHRLTVTLPAEDPGVDGDLLRVTQILSNLLTNAGKYTDPNGRIDLTATVMDGEVEIEVRDSGIGISAEALTSVFTMFSQVSVTSTRAEGGLGIGLALVKGLVDLHGGTIRAASDGVGCGSTFTVRLPRAAERAERGPTELHDATEHVPTRRRVLIVDDNRDSADALGLLLELAGHEVRIAHDGLTALSIAGTFRPALVLLDIGMPGMNGYDVAKALRQEPWGEALCLTAMTGWGQDEDRRQAHEAGFDHHLTKPVDPDAVEALVANCQVPAQQSAGTTRVTAVGPST